MPTTDPKVLSPPGGRSHGACGVLVTFEEQNVARVTPMLAKPRPPRSSKPREKGKEGIRDTFFIFRSATWAVKRYHAPPPPSPPPEALTNEALEREVKIGGAGNSGVDPLAGGPTGGCMAGWWWR